MFNNKIIGNSGEDMAAEFLARNGYFIRERQYRIKDAEIDIIAEKQDIIAFIEVKTRRSLRFGTPASAVTYAKQKKIIRAAGWYIAQKNINDRQFRFDIIEIWRTKTGQWQIRQIENAFEARW